MAVINGINQDTIKNMQLDAGILIADKLDAETIQAGVGWDSTIKTAISQKKHVGATKGATTFSATPEIRNIFEGIDGVRGDIKNGNVIDKWEVTLKTSITEFTLKNLEICLGASTEGSSGTHFDTIEPADMIANEDYKSFTWIGTMAGGEKPIVIVLNNCLNINGLTITAEDKNTGTVEVELKAHIDLTKIGQEKQFKIYLPKDRTILAASEAKELKLDK